MRTSLSLVLVITSIVVAIAVLGTAFYLFNQSRGPYSSFQIETAVKLVAINHDGTYIAAADYEEKVHLWRNDGTKSHVEINHPGAMPFALTFLKNRDVLIVGYNDGYVRVYDTETGMRLVEQQTILADEASVVYRFLRTGQAYPEIGGVFALAVNSEETELLVAGVNGQFALIDIATWSVIEAHTLPASFDITITAFDSTANSVVLSTRSDKRMISIWNRDRSVVINSIEARLYEGIGAVRFLNDEDLALIAYPSDVALFHIASSRDDFVQYTLNVRNFSVAEISASGNYFARGGVEATGEAVTDGLPIIGQSDYTVYLHRLPRIHDELQRTEAQQGWCIEFKQGSSRELIPIQCPISEPIRSFRGHTDVVVSIAFDTIDTYLVTGSRDGTVKVWLLD